ncbi:CDP-6-deoxy-delta-3,4-glucoseen reductase [Ralstonia solanacearum]|nr:CDP-6-deoxy-delta-3,4-glucoseen reductase [Ralstonia solanacearum]
MDYPYPIASRLELNREGASAFSGGQDVDTCPYEYNTPHANEWKAGFLLAEHRATHTRHIVQRVF